MAWNQDFCDRYEPHAPLPSKTHVSGYAPPLPWFTTVKSPLKTCISGGRRKIFEKNQVTNCEEIYSRRISTLRTPRLKTFATPQRIWQLGRLYPFCPVPDKIRGASGTGIHRNFEQIWLPTSAIGKTTEVDRIERWFFSCASLWTSGSQSFLVYGTPLYTASFRALDNQNNIGAHSSRHFVRINGSDLSLGKEEQLAEIQQYRALRPK